MSDVKLLPCPFCGSEAIRSNVYIRDGREVICDECGAMTPAYNPDAHTKSVAKWNTRSTSDHASALAEKDRVIERLREALEAVQQCFERTGSWPPSIMGKVRAALAQHEHKEGMNER